MHLFFKICSYFKKYATIMHLCKLDSLKDLLLWLFLIVSPLNKCFHNCIFRMRIKFMQESEVE